MWIHAHRTGLLQVVRADLAGGLVDVGVAGSVLIPTPGVAPAIVSARRLLPLLLGGQGYLPVARAACILRQEAGLLPRLGRQPGAEGHRVPPTDGLARVVPVLEPLLTPTGAMLRGRDQPLPPTILLEAILGVQEHLELGIGDGIAGNPEGVQRLVSPVLVRPATLSLSVELGNLVPLDVG